MAKRKGIGKRKRFEVFKRDGFTCGYCGRTPPAVTLHVDHVNAVAEGGSDDEDNLITACVDCNLGKGAVPLSQIPHTIQEKADLLREREQQLSAYQEMLDQKNARLEREAARVVEVYESSEDGWTLSDEATRSVRQFIEAIGVHEVIEAMEIACERRKGTSQLFKYFCGICWNKIRSQKGD